MSIYSFSAFIYDKFVQSENKCNFILKCSNIKHKCPFVHSMRTFITSISIMCIHISLFISKTNIDLQKLCRKSIILNNIILYSLLVRRERKHIKPTKIRWYILFGLIWPMTLLMQLDRTTLAVSAPVIQKHFGFSIMEMSLILSSFYWAYAFANLPAGVWVQKVGSRKGLLVSCVWWSIMTILMPPAMSIIPLLILFRIMLGIGQAADWPASILTISNWFPKNEKARASGILLGSMYCGSLIGKPLTAWIVEAFGWEWSFYSFGIINLLLAWLWYKYIRDLPHEHPLVNEAEKHYIAEGAETKVVKRVSWQDWKMLINNYQFWAMGGQYFLLILIQSFYNTWLPTYLMNTRQISLTKMGFLASMPWLSMFVMVMVMGQVVDWVYKRTASPRIARVPFAIAGFLISALFLYLGAMEKDLILMIVYLMISMAGVATVQVALWATCQDIAGPRSASMTGWMSFCGNLGNALGPILTAYFIGTSGDWSRGLTLLAISGALGAIVWLFIRPDRPWELPEEENSCKAVTIAK